MIRVGDVIQRGALSAIRQAEGARWARVYDRAPREDRARAAAVSAAFVRLRHVNLVAGQRVFLADDEAPALLLPVLSFGMTAPTTRAGVLSVVAQVAHGLSALHDAGVLHLGVCREALVQQTIYAEASAILGDSEVARHDGFAPPPPPTYAGQSWIAPELGLDGRADARADVYGLGVLLHELCFGAAPPAPCAPHATGDEALDALFARLLAEAPARRPSTMADVLGELARAGWTPGPQPVAGKNATPATGPLVLIAPVASTVTSTPERYGIVEHPAFHERCEVSWFEHRLGVAPRPGGTIQVSGRTITRPPDPAQTAEVAQLVVGDLVRAGELVFVAGATPPAGPVPATVPPPRPAAPPAAPPPGRDPHGLGEWRIEHELGAGGMSEVFRVRHRRDGRQAVAKVLTHALANDEAVRRRFEREVRVLRRLRHHCVVRQLDAGETADGRPFIVMQDAGPDTLQARLQQGPVPLAEAIGVVSDVLSGLGRAHAMGLVHRDVKPSNVFLPRHLGDFARLADFGIAHAAEAFDEDDPRRDRLTAPGGVVGTPLYLSPEQCQGLPVDGRSDLYAIGCLLHELLAGQPPFSGRLVDLIMAHINAPPPPLPASVPPPLRAVVARLLAKAPEDRPASALEARRELLAAVPPVTGAPPPGVRAREREPGIWELPDADGQRVVIVDGLDRRPGPRLRLEALDYLDRERPPGFVSARRLAALEGRWQRFLVGGAPPALADDARLAPGPATAVAAGAAVGLVTLARAARCFGGFSHASVHARADEPGDLEVRLAPPDDPEALADGGDTSAPWVRPGWPHATEPRELALRQIGLLGLSLLAGPARVAARRDVRAALPPLPPALAKLADALLAHASVDLAEIDEWIDALPRFLAAAPGWLDAAEHVLEPLSPAPAATVPPPPMTVPPMTAPPLPMTAPPRPAAPPTAPRFAAGPIAEVSLERVSGHIVVGQRFGAWRVLRALGEGGMSAVFEIEHVTLGRRAVVKTLIEPLASDPHVFSRFVDEARAVNQFRHPNVVEVQDIGLDETGRPFMVMELLPGESLEQELRRSGPPPVDEALEIVRQVARALGAAHAAGIVHRDIKPANVMIVSREPLAVKIIDFGIARVPRSAGALTHSGQIMGTPAYMAPEVWQGATRAAPVSDLWALGVTLHEALSGAQPFPGHSISDTAHAVQTHLPGPPRSPHGPLPPALVELVGRLLEKDPARRPASAAEVVAVLDRLLPPPAARGGPEDLLRAAGFSEARTDGMTVEGLPRYRGRFRGAPATVYLAPARLLAIRQRARVEAMRALVAAPSPLFVPMVAELTLADGTTALVRSDPVPAPLAEGTRVPVAAALAVTAVVHRALALLAAAGRRHESFTLTQVRAALADPTSFACLLQPPIRFDRSEEMATTMAGNEIAGDPQYYSPGQLLGEDSPHDAAYAAGVLAYSLLAGEPPLPRSVSIFELSNRKTREDPPRLAARRGLDVPAEVAAFVDGLVARDARARARDPRAIEAQLLELLAGQPAWLAAVRARLDAAPALPAPAPAAAAARDDLRLRPVARALADGERVAGWTVTEHLRFGGDAETYRVHDDAGRRGVLKLWYDAAADPFSEAWGRFRRGMQDLARRPGFPELFELDVHFRGRPRAFAVFAEIDAPDAGALVRRGPRPGPALLELGARLLAALGDAHAVLGAVGDVSPANVLVRGDAPILLDVAMPGRARGEIAGYGTPGHVAPEIADGQPPSARADVFSAGLLLVELGLGRPLFGDVVDGTLFPVGGFAAPLAAALAALRASPAHGPLVAEALAPLCALDPARRPDAAAAAAALAEAAARVRVRAAARAHTGSSSLIGLERRLPRPLAQALRGWRLALAPRDRVSLGWGLAETIARYLAAVALADYLTGAPDPAVEPLLAPGQLDRLAFGRWIQLGRTIGRANDRRGGAFVPELAEFFAGRGGDGLAALEAVVPLRNRPAHGRPVIPDGDLARVEGETTRLVRELLDAVRFLSQYPLLAPLEQRTRRDRSSDGTFLELHGSAGEPEHRRLRSREPAPASTVVMCTPDLAERLILDPFVVQRPCKPCGVIQHTYVFTGADRAGDLTYLDQATDHRHGERPVDESGAPCPLPELLARRAELLLRGPLGVAAGEAERFWSGDAPMKPGETVDGLVLDEEIGRGAMGVVYRAHDPTLGGVRAVKIVRPEVLGEDRTPLRRLRDEARRLERLGDHPGIVRVFRFGMTADETNCFLVMELLEGGTLEDRLRADAPPPLAEVLSLAAQLTDAVRAVHRADIVHRDLKPANVLFAAPDRVKIVDFGVARDLRARATQTTGFAGATPLYCAPEQQAGGEVGRWTDVYALGLLLYDLARGKPAALEPLRRALALRAAVRALREGRPVDELAHHAGDPRLLPFLDALVAMTEAEPKDRPTHLELPGGLP